MKEDKKSQDETDKARLDYISHMLGHNRKMALNALRIIFSNHMKAKLDSTYDGSGKAGFKEKEQDFLCGIVTYYMKRDSISLKQEKWLFRTMPHYAEQLLGRNRNSGIATEWQENDYQI